MKCMKGLQMQCARYRTARDKAGFMKCMAKVMEKSGGSPTMKGPCDKFKAARDKAGYMKCMQEFARPCNKYREAKDKAGWTKCMSDLRRKFASGSSAPATPKPTPKPTP